MFEYHYRININPDTDYCVTAVTTHSHPRRRKCGRTAAAHDAATQASALSAAPHSPPPLKMEVRVSLVW